MTELNELIIKRGVIKAKLTRFNTFLKNNPNKNQIQLRLIAVQPLLEQFDEIQLAIELIDKESDSHAFERETFENAYFGLISHANEIIAENEVTKRANFERAVISQSPDPSMVSADADTSNIPPPPNIATQNVPNQINSIQNANVKLPQINLVTFDEIEKFHYLRASLKGDAIDVIRSLEICTANYKVAWDLLVERFENKNALIFTHVRKIFELPSASRESFEVLRRLVDNLAKHLGALKALNQPVDHWDALMIYIITNKLDFRSRRDWGNSIAQDSNSFPSVNDLLKFLRDKCLMLEALSSNNANPKASNKATSLYVGRSFNDCPVCGSSHLLFLCKKFASLNTSERLDKVKSLKLCSNCLRPNHVSKYCKLNQSCKTCGQRHHTLLHKNEVEAPNKERVERVESQTTVSNLNVYSNQVLLSTAKIQIVDNKGHTHIARALLDSGSQSNFITSNLADKLQLNHTKIDITVSGFSQMLSKIKSKASVQIKSLIGHFSKSIDCLVVDRISDPLPSSSVNKLELYIPSSLSLADPEFNVKGPIDLLIGADTFWSIIRPQRILLGKHLPILQKTQLGWIVGGPLCSNLANNTHQSLLCSVNADDLHQLLSDFWKVEERTSEVIPKTTEGDHCEKLFSKTTYRNDDGRFVVRLPFNGLIQSLGESYLVAEKILSSTERHLKGNPEIKEKYKLFMKEYEELKHMSSVNYSDKDLPKAYFLPHHAVIKPESSTTKLRVVFDGSCKSSTNVSLNDCLMVGPVVQEELFFILLRFRSHQYAIISDCEKMYRQILIHPEDRIKQNILWRQDDSDQIKCYQLKTVTYGTASASYLATRCLHQISLDSEVDDPQTSRVIGKDFYVDDLITSVNSRDDAKTLITNLIKLFSSYGFSLRKWASNDSSLLDGLENENITQFKDSSNCVKTLGLYWDSTNDEFTFPVNMCDKTFTKRSVLSTISKLFDPLGLMGPVTFLSKCIMQQLWSSKVSWDESLPSNLLKKWEEFLVNLPYIQKIHIPRLVVIPNAVDIHLHGFADASSLGYGAAIYLRSSNSSGQVHVSLLCSKSRVAPLKSLSTARLELCGAVLLATLVSKIKDKLNLDISGICYWTDSTIVLCWLNKSPHELKTFVSNRVTEINDLTNPSQWRHIRSADNPADILSRGMLPNQLAQANGWWCGPSWLIKPCDEWPETLKVSKSAENVPELKVSLHNSLCTNLSEDSSLINELFQNYSNLQTIVGIVSYIKRFIKNCRVPSSERQVGPMSLSETNDSMILLIKNAQSAAYSNEVILLKAGKPISNKSKILPLKPFLDENHLLRVGGRLDNSNLSYEQRHPLILPKGHRLTQLFIHQIHTQYFHANLQFVLATIRLKYWPIDGKSAIKKIIRNCVTCRRRFPQTTQPIMADLPKPRVIPSRPFSTVGTDYAGPFYVVEGHRRGVKTKKAYLCIFICFATKAVHLEVVSNLTTEAFLACLKRFVSRRGLCSDIHSDNGTNFVGANKELRSVYTFIQNSTKDSDILNYFKKNSIHWHFIPARSPHFGGLWEAAVKSVKRHLSHLTKDHKFTYEELTTCITQIEAIINSRPLIPLSSDPDDFSYLSPSHFLIGSPLLAVPEVNQELPLNKLNYYQKLTQIQQQLWKRWSNDYLSLLQKRTKWKTTQGSPLKPGDLVLLREPTPPLYWRLGRILTLHPGKDNINRAASVKTSSGILTRAVNRLSKFLPEDDEACDKSV